MKYRAWMILGLFLIAGAIWLAPLAACPTCVPFQPGAAHTDLLVSHWPNAEFLRNALREWGKIPLWNPTILSGAPFAADPLAGLWYPPNWLLLVLPLSFGFNLLLWLHLAWASWGAYRLLRAEGVGVPGAVLAGLAFGGMPKLVGHAGLGHVGLVMAVSWTAWLLLAVHRVADKLRLRDAALAGAALGMIFLIDPRWAIPSGLLSAIYMIWHLAHSHKARGLRWGRVGANAGVAGLFAAGTAAVLALPLWEFTRLSTRSELVAGEQSVLSLPAGHLFGLVLPDVGGYAEWMVYAGVVVLILAFAAIAAARPGWGMWSAVALTSLLLSLGDATPLHGLLSAIPGLDLLRVPPRWLFIFGFSMAMLAGKGFDVLMDGDLPKDAARRLRLCMAALGAAFFLLMVGVIVIGMRSHSVPWPSWALASGIGALAAILAWLRASGRFKPRIFAVSVLVLVTIELGFVNVSMLEARPVEDLLERPAFIQDDDLLHDRIFSPSYSVPQSIAVREGLELADGVNPLQLSAYRDFMSSATGFSEETYSVTLPPFPSGDPSEDWSPQIDARQLGLLNVGRLVSAFELDAEGLELERAIGDVYLYRNTHVRPRAWVEPQEGGDDVWIEAAIVDRTPGSVVVTASGPGRLVLSEIAYPGWHAYLDGELVEIDVAYDVLRSVDIPAGEREVIFRFDGWMVQIGAGMTLLALIGLAAMRWKR